MNMEAKRKYTLLGIIILLIAAIAAGTSGFWKDGAAENAKQGYVAVIRIDGPIYGGPEADSPFRQQRRYQRADYEGIPSGPEGPPGQGYPGAYQQPRRFHRSHPGNR